MQINDILTWTTRGCFFLLAVLTLRDYWHQRDQARLDIALLFNALAVLYAAQVFSEITGVTSWWLGAVALMTLVAQPHLTLRLVQHFRVIPRWLHRASLSGMLINWLLIILMATALPTLVILVIVVYFVSIDGYAAWAFMQGAYTTRGVTQKRLLLAAWGSGLIGCVIFIIGLGTLLPQLNSLLSLLARFGAAVIAVIFYLAFTPPRWLRRTWQLSEMYDFLRLSAQLLSEQRTNDLLNTLCTSATRITDGRATLVTLWDEAQNRFIVRASDNPHLGEVNFSKDDPDIQRTWQAFRPMTVHLPVEASTGLYRLAISIGAATLYLIPIATAQHIWGVLIIFLRQGSLFPDDDLQLLSLFAGQGAITLEHARLLDDQQRLVEQLQEEVNERQQAEIHILQLNDVLERRAVELQNANQELEAFSYSVSHDLRAPLRAVDGFSRILQEEYAAQLTSDAARYLNLVRTNTQKMGQLIDDLLKFSRLSRQPLTTQPINLTEIVHWAWSGLSDEQENRKIEFSVESDLPLCQADSGLLQQVFANLLGNALKFTRKRDVAHIMVGYTQHNNEQIYYVKDNGVGFDMRYAHKLFGVFQRLHRAEEYDGTGVGLATVQRIIRRHGGRIWAESEVDKGATFYFTLKGEAPNDVSSGNPAS